MSINLEVSIKNNKSFPAWLEGFSTLVLAKDELGNKISVARIFYRATTTRRRVHSGENRWDLFAVEVLRNDYRVTNRAVMPDVEVHLGRRDGEDIAVTFGRVFAKAQKLPNGFTLSEEVQWEVVSFRSEFPNQELVGRGLYLLPFHQPGGTESRLEEIDQKEFLAKEQISWLARRSPVKWREVSSRPIQEQLDKMAVIAQQCGFAQFFYDQGDEAAREAMLKKLGLEKVDRDGEEHWLGDLKVSAFEFDTGRVVIQIQGDGVEKLALPCIGESGLSLGVISEKTELQWNWDVNTRGLPIRFRSRLAKDGLPAAL